MVNSTRFRLAKSCLFLIIFIFFFVLSFLMKGYIIALLATIFMVGVLASSWNLMAGFCGYISFGQQAFFGIGAYATAMLVTSLKLGIESFWYSILFGGIISSCIAFILGYPALILKGPYFSILTLGFSEILYVIVVNVSWFGSGVGINLPPVYTLTKFYIVTLITFAAVFLTFAWLKKSKFGFALSAIRQDEDSAKSSGINTHLYKMVAFTISGFFPGIIGGASAWYTTYVDAGAAFDIHILVQMIAVTIFGGLGTVVGPMIGSFIFTFLSEYLWARMPELYPIALGTVIVIVIYFMPHGVVVRILEALKIKII